ncbi:MAG: hypothetical protein AAF587_09175 [Bacteroidota bacterium]
MLFILLIASLGIHDCAYPAPPESIETETLRFEMSLPTLPSKSVLVLSNIHGEVNVEGYSGNTIQVEVFKTVKAKSKSTAQKGLTELKLSESIRGDTTEIVLDFPWERKDGGKGRWSGKYGYHSHGWHWDPDYEFQLDFSIRIPREMQLNVSTVNQGSVTVEDVRGSITANNVNGPIILEQIEGQVNAKTINGDVKISYSVLPKWDSQFYSQNGTIKVESPRGLAARMFFQSFNGEFYTNLDPVVVGREEISKEQHPMENGIQYSISSRSPIISRNGKTVLEFETYNGDVYVEESN